MSQARSTALSAVLCVGNVSLSTPMLIYEKRVQYSLSTAVLLYSDVKKSWSPALGQPLAPYFNLVKVLFFKHFWTYKQQ